MTDNSAHDDIGILYEQRSYEQLQDSLSNQDERAILALIRQFEHYQAAGTSVVQQTRLRLTHKSTQDQIEFIQEQIVQPGWRACQADQSGHGWNEEMLQLFKQGQFTLQVDVQNTDWPSLDELLAQLECQYIGRPSTLANMLEQLDSSGQIVIDPETNQVRLSGLGEMVLTTLQSELPELSAAAFTTSLSLQLEQIAHGQSSARELILATYASVYGEAAAKNIADKIWHELDELYQCDSVSSGVRHGFIGWYG